VSFFTASLLASLRPHEVMKLQPRPGFVVYE
jgi:hypothetical protein